MERQTAFILGISMAGPVIGSLAGVLLRPKETFLLAMLSFAGGTMLAISFLEMIPESIAMCGITGCIVGLLVGLLLMMLLSSTFASLHVGKQETAGNLEHVSLLMLAAIFLHNFPEGMAMASGTTMPHPGKALMIAIAIAVHDIPEGICTSAPYFYATGKRLRAFLQSASTALPVLIGFWLGKNIFNILNPYTMGMIVGAIAGLMIYISCEELIPTSQKGKLPRISMASLMMGIVFVLILGTISP